MVSALERELDIVEGDLCLVVMAIVGQDDRQEGSEKSEVHSWGEWLTIDFSKSGRNLWRKNQRGVPVNDQNGRYHLFNRMTFGNGISRALQGKGRRNMATVESCLP